MTKEDLELIDALVRAGVISRPVAREVASCAQPGKAATFISERGLCNTGDGHVIIDRLAKYETIQAEASRFVEDLASRPVRVIGDVGLYDSRVHGQCSCGGSRNAYLSCEVHATQPETD